MMEIKGYVNPRSLGNSEPNNFLGMDVFIESELWDKYINRKKGDAVVRTWDTVFMLTMMTSPHRIESGTARFPVYYHTSKPVQLRAYLHSQFQALCIGIAKLETDSPGMGAS